MQRKTRLFLVLLFIILGAVLHFKQGMGSAWYLYIAALVLLATHFLFGNVWAAFGMLKKGKLTEAENLIEEIKRPDFLLKGHRAYYYFVKGMIALQNKEYPEAEKSLSDALSTGLRTANDKALTSLNLAHICFLQNRFQDSRVHLKNVQAQQTSDLMIKDKMKDLEAALVGK